MARIQDWRAVVESGDQDDAIELQEYAAHALAGDPCLVGLQLDHGKYLAMTPLRIELLATGEIVTVDAQCGRLVIVHTPPPGEMPPLDELAELSGVLERRIEEMDRADGDAP